MSLSRSLDVGKSLGERKSAEKLLKTKDEPKVKIRKVDHDRADAISEEAEEIESVPFSKPRRGTPLKLGPMALDRFLRVERLFLLAVLLLVGVFVLFHSAGLPGIEQRSEFLMKEFLLERTLEDLRTQFPLASPSELSQRASQMLFSLLHSDEADMIQSRISAEYKELYSWDDGPPYLFSSGAWRVAWGPDAFYVGGVVGLAVLLLVFVSASVLTRSFPAAFLASFLLLLVPSVLDVLMAGNLSLLSLMVLSGALIMAGTALFFSGHKLGILLAVVGFGMSLFSHTWAHWIFAGVAGSLLWLSARGPRWLPFVSWVACFGVFTLVFSIVRSTGVSVVDSLTWPVLLLAFLGLGLLLFCTSDYPKPFMLAAGAFASLLASSFFAPAVIPLTALVAVFLVAVLAERAFLNAPSLFEWLGIGMRKYSRPALAVVCAASLFLLLWPSASAVTERYPSAHDSLVNAARIVDSRLFVYENYAAWDFFCDFEVVKAEHMLSETELCEGCYVAVTDATLDSVNDFSERQFMLSPKSLCTDAGGFVKCGEFLVNKTSLKIARNPVSRVIMVEEEVRSASFDSKNDLHLIVIKEGDSYIGRVVDAGLSSTLLARLWMGSAPGFVPVFAADLPERLLLFRVEEGAPGKVAEVGSGLDVDVASLELESSLLSGLE